MTMFMGFLDASKAFDRIRHSTFFKKLIDRQVPSYIVRIILVLVHKSKCVCTVVWDFI